MTYCMVVNKYHSPYEVDIQRPGPWGNPYHAKEWSGVGEVGKFTRVATREEAIKAHRAWMHFRLHTAGITPEDHPDRNLREELLSLQGQRLGCTCNPKACHGDTLKELSDHLAAGHVLEVNSEGYYWVEAMALRNAGQPWLRTYDGRLDG